MLALEVKPRDKKQSPDELRESGFIPAVFYGPKEASTPIVINAKQMEHVWKAAGQTSVITLQGAGEAKDTLIYDVQVHPVTGAVLHADFYVLEKGKKIQISVPLVFDGHAPAEKLGHIIVKALHEVEVEVAPAELPHTLSVDLSALENVGDRILASQIKLPGSATLITHGEEIVASVTEFIEEKEPEQPAAAAVETPAEATPAPETPAAQ